MSSLSSDLADVEARRILAEHQVLVDPSDTRTYTEILAFVGLSAVKVPEGVVPTSRSDQVHNLTANLETPQDLRIGRLGRTAL